MEVRIRLLGGDHGHVVGEERVERMGDPLRRRPTVDFDARSLASRMDAGVGAAGDGQRAPGREDAVQGV